NPPLATSAAQAIDLRRGLHGSEHGHHDFRIDKIALPLRIESELFEAASSARPHRVFLLPDACEEHARRGAMEIRDPISNDRLDWQRDRVVALAHDARVINFDHPAPAKE